MLRQQRVSVDDRLRDVDELPIAVACVRAEQFEGLILFDRVAFHQDPLRTFGEGAPTESSLEIVVFREAQENDLDCVSPGGRLVVVAFHSLEDRIVKRFLQERSQEARGSRHAPETRAAPPTFRLVTRRAVEPGDAEVAANPRARSAKLRAAVRTAAPARAIDFAAIGVPQLRGVMGPEAYA